MFENADTMATVAVKDVKAAAKFYEGTLGLQSAGGEEQEVRAYKSGNSTILVYEDDSTCSTGTLVTGSESDFESPGIAVTVEINSHHAFYAAAKDHAGNVSPCTTTAFIRPAHLGSTQ